MRSTGFVLLTATSNGFGALLIDARLVYVSSIFCSVCRIPYFTSISAITLRIIERASHALFLDARATEKDARFVLRYLIRIICKQYFLKKQQTADIPFVCQMRL
uniref:Uncharacterized protein n=1 Tax=Anopheles dirus TaxID=7168 RepID=A0A182NYL0_9DIPT